MKFTDHLKLTQYQANDHLSWRDRYNSDMRTIDAATASTTAFAEQLVEDIDEYHKNVEEEFDKLEERDRDLAAQTASVLAYAEKETELRKLADVELEARVRANTSSVAASTVELIEKLEERVVQNDTDLQNQIDLNKVRIVAAEKSVKDLQDDIAELPITTASVQALQVRMATAEDDIGDLLAQGTDYGRRIGNIETEQTTQNMRIETLEDTTSEHGTAIDAINTRLTNYEPTIGTVSILSGRMDIVEENLQGMVEEVKPLVTQVEENRVQIATNKQGIADNKTAISDVKNSISTLETEVGDFDSRIKNTQTLVDSANATASSAQMDAHDATLKLINVTGSPHITDTGSGTIISTAGNKKGLINSSKWLGSSSMQTLSLSPITGHSEGSPVGQFVGLLDFIYDSGQFKVNLGTGSTAKYYAFLPITIDYDDDNCLVLKSMGTDDFYVVDFISSLVVRSNNWGGTSGNRRISVTFDSDISDVVYSQLVGSAAYVGSKFIGIVNSSIPSNGYIGIYGDTANMSEYTPAIGDRIYFSGTRSAMKA